MLGLRGLRIEASARDIQARPGAALRGDLGRIREHMGRLGAHLGNAQKQVRPTPSAALARFEAKLGAIGRAAEGQDAQQSLLPPPP